MSITYRLRSAAERYGLAAPKVATLMLEAADTIDSMCAMRDTWQENDAKLRELVRGLKYCAHEAHGMCARVPVGGERPFTCCPLYDFDAKEYQCEKLIHELGMEFE